jgi:DNA-nicking Smr family endonuclease
MEKAKERHSKLLTQLFEEAEPVFREIRKILNDLAVKRSQPIKKVASISQVMANNPSDLGRGGAPGQIIFPIIVGNVEDLYKSSKYGNRNHSKSKNDTKRRLSIDLHGCTTDQALRSLNDSLPKWIENAMRGSYPFCSAVDIITGGGAQILSEAVEMWIQKQKHVARRPKSFTF